MTPDFVARVGVPPTFESLTFPGGAGVFLYIGAAASLLDFTVIPAIHEIAIVLDWQLTVQ